MRVKIFTSRDAQDVQDKFNIWVRDNKPLGTHPPQLSTSQHGAYTQYTIMLTYMG